MESNMTPVYIYALIEPDTRLIRYIGKSIRPLARLRAHINDKSICHRTNWIKSLKERGLEPALLIIEEIIGEWPWQEAEMFWIAYAKKHGWPLVNSTDGGDGVCNLSGESKERMAKTWLGRKHKPESRAKMSAANKGKLHTEEYKQYMREIMRDRQFTDEWRHKLSIANRKLTEEQVKEIRERRNNGELVKYLAEEFGVHRTTITNLCKKHYYNDID